MFRSTQPTGTSSAVRGIACALCLAAVSTLAAAQVSAPRLRTTTAPFVGQALKLEVDAAIPGSSILVYFSREAGSSSTPYGRLELSAKHLTLLATGVTTASGTWSYVWDVPLHVGVAETGAHWQAVVLDPSAPSGAVLSNAIHARFLGSRVYAGYGAAGSAGILVLSAVTDEVVARVDCAVGGASYGFPREGKPVFDAVFSRGAAMITDREMVLFDPSYGAVLRRVAFASPCSRTLFTDAARRSAYVLELAGSSSPARVHAIDLVTGAATTALVLPSPVEPMWCADDLSAEVFVAERRRDGRTAIRRVGLDPLVDRGATAVGDDASDGFLGYDGTQVIPLPLVYAAGQLFVSTRGSVGPSVHGSLTRCVRGATGLSTEVMALGTNLIYAFAAVPAADRLFGGVGATMFGPSFQPCAVPLSTSLRMNLLEPPLPTGAFYIRDAEPDGQTVWVVAEMDWQTPDQLFRYDMPTRTWSRPFHSWYFGPSDAELVRDAWNHELWVSNVGLGPPVNIAPEILVVDELQGRTRHIALDRTATVLHAVPLP